MSSPAMLSLRQAVEMTSLSRTYINMLRRAGKFPEAIPLGEKRIGFLRSEVEAWLTARIEAARGAKRGPKPEARP